MHETPPPPPKKKKMYRKSELKFRVLCYILLLDISPNNFMYTIVIRLSYTACEGELGVPLFQLQALCDFF